MQMGETYFQFYGGKDPIDKAVTRVCQSGEIRTKKQPVTGWISQASASQTGSLVFWTQAGVLRYIGSGLLGWQCSVSQSDIRVREISVIGEPTYSDKHQLICSPSNIKDVGSWPLVTILERFGIANVRHSVIVYVTRKSRFSEEDVLVYEVTKAAQCFKVPAQELVANEHPCEASFRSLTEQSGIDSQIQFRKLGMGYGYDFQLKEFQVIHYFQSPSHSELPDQWEFKRSGSFSNGRELVKYSWIPITRAKATLPRDQAAKLDLIETHS